MLIAMLHYQEFLPHPALRDLIHLYGVMGDSSTYSEFQVQKTPPIINKGLVFHYRRDTNLFVDNGHFEGELPRAYILPQGSTPIVWKHRGGFAIFSVIFKPGMFRHIYPQPFLEFLNGALDFNTFNDWSLLQLRDQIFYAKNQHQRIFAANAFFLKKLRQISSEPDWLNHAWHLIYTQPQTNIDDISKQVYKSKSQFRKRFIRAFGISPKKLQQLIRITYAVNSLTHQPNTRLTDLAMSCGYSDQSHFINHFKSNTGVSPLAFCKQQQSITKFINYNEVVQDGLSV